MTVQQQANPTRHSFRVLVVAVIVPVVLTLVALVVLLALAANSPSRVATHWGFAGQANGYGSPYTYAILMGSVTVPLIAVLGVGTVVLAHRVALSPIMKIAAIAPVWMSTLIGTLLVGSLLHQQTSAEVAAVKSPGLDILVGVIAAFVLGVAAWFALPKAARRGTSADAAPTPAVNLAADERASWLRTTSVSGGVLLVLVGVTLLVGAAEVLVIFTSGGRLWGLAFVPVGLLILVLINFAWSIRVDARGVRIRSIVGIPAFTIPLSNIVSASVVEVSAMTEFGGFGIRWNLNGRLGIIMRSGPALSIRRRKGIDVVVTVDDAATAAALLNGLVQRQATLK